MTSYFDKLCSSPFWDANLTWHTEDPDLTPCFEKTVLVWLPGLFFIILLPLECCWIRISTDKQIPWSWLNVSKLIVIALMMVVTITNFIHVTQTNNIYLADISAPIVQFFIFVAIMVLVLVHKGLGIRASYVLFLTSFVLVLCQTPQVYSIFRVYLKNRIEDVFSSTICLGLYILLWGFFILHWFCDKPPKYSKFPNLEKPSPEISASIPSRLALTWFSPLVRLGALKPLETSDMHSLNRHNSSSYIVPLFQRHWASSLHKAHPKVLYENHSSKVGFQRTEKCHASIVPALIKSFGPFFLLGSLLKLVSDLMVFVNPQLLKLVIQFVSSDDSMWKGCMFAFLMYVVASIQMVNFKRYFIIMNTVGIRITTALISAIYRKSLKLSNAARKQSTVGEIVNLMAVDVPTFDHLMFNINLIWSAPLQITLALIFLWQLLGR